MSLPSLRNATPGAEPRLSPADAWKLALLLAFAPVVPLVACFGGMAALVLAIAITLAVWTYRHPTDVIVTGTCFLLAVDVFFPSTARFDANNATEPWEMYFWATGVLLITLAPLPKLGAGMLREMPASVRAFLLVAVAASVYGLLRGNATSYVFRQLFGSILFIAYFMFAQRSGDEAAFVRGAKSYAVVCALAFVVYYVWVFDEWGIHKEITTLGTQASILGILFVGQKGWTWYAAAAVLFLVPILLIQRHDLAVFALAPPLLWAITAKSKPARWLAWGMVSLVVLVSLAPPLVEIVLDTAVGTSSVDNLLPVGARDSTSIADRLFELASASAIVQQSPLLGHGMGSTIAWEAAVRGNMEQAYVDNGWAYIVSKMGLLGLASFAWIVVGLLRRMQHGSTALSVCLLCMLLLVNWAEPVFFQFTTSPFAGVVAGLLWGKAEARSRLQTA